MTLIILIFYDTLDNLSNENFIFCFEQVRQKRAYGTWVLKKPVKSIGFRAFKAI